jgi:hypothetical protein
MPYGTQREKSEGDSRRRGDAPWGSNRYCSVAGFPRAIKLVRLSRIGVEPRMRYVPEGARPPKTQSGSSQIALLANEPARAQAHGAIVRSSDRMGGR